MAHIRLFPLSVLMTQLNTMTYSKRAITVSNGMYIRFHISFYGQALTVTVAVIAGHTPQVTVTEYIPGCVISIDCVVAVVLSG